MVGKCETGKQGTTMHGGKCGKSRHGEPSDMALTKNCGSMVRTFTIICLSVCLFVYLQHNSKTNDSKVFQLDHMQRRSAAMC